MRRDGKEADPRAYREDLAFIHDAGFTRHAASAAPVLLDAVRRGGFDNGLVIDLGCGSGVLAAELASAGYDVLGIDISSAMVAIAQERVPAGRFRAESLLSAKLEPCVAVSAVGECFNYLFDRRNSVQTLSRLFERIHRVLAPGGVFLFDVATPGRVPGRGVQKTHAHGEGWAVIVSAEEDAARKQLTRRITSFRRVGELYRRDDEIHRLRLLDRAEIASQLRAVGFRVRVLSGYGSSRFPKGYVGFLARKVG